MPANNPVIFNTVADRNRVFNTLDQKWSKVDKLLQGTDAMRAAGTDMLPKGENEEETVYKERLNEATLHPLYKQAVYMTTSMIVSDDITVSGITGDFQDFYDDVDGAGTDITQFSEMLIKTAVHYGIGYALIDFPRADEPNGRPFYSVINPRNVLGFNTQRINGREQLVDFRFLETISKEEDVGVGSGNSETISDINQVEEGLFADQIRQYRLDPETGKVSFVMWRRSKRDLQWTEFDSGEMAGVDRIPIVAAYGNKESYFIGTPVYFDTAELNIKLWRTMSIQDYALKFNRYPAYIVTGIGQEQNSSPSNPNDIPSGEEANQQNLIKIPYGPGAIIGTPNPNVTIQKFDGQSESLNLGFEDIDRTIRAIKESAPILTLTDLEADVTATATTIHATQAIKTVQKIARNYRNSLLQMAAFVQPYFNTSEFPSFEIQTLIKVTPAADINQTDN